MSEMKDNTARIVNLMQFARKAGKVIAGTEACLRALHGKGLQLLVIASDTAPRTINRIENATADSGKKVPAIRISRRAELSAALGLPLTAVYGILDRQFASKMLEYYAARQVEE